jgi:hypothetical protein
VNTETIYVVTQITSEADRDPEVVLATIDFDQALESLRESRLLPGVNEYRYCDVWRSGVIKQTLFIGENGLQTAQVAVRTEAVTT